MYGAHVQWAQEMRWPQVTLASLFLSFFSFLLSFFLSFLLSFFLSSFALFLGSVRRCCERIHRVRLTVGARCLSRRRFLVRRCGVSESAAAAPRRETAVESRAKGGGERGGRGDASPGSAPRATLQPVLIPQTGISMLSTPRRWPLSDEIVVRSD